MNNYEELKTVFKEYIVHNRTVTICVKEVGVEYYKTPFDSMVGFFSIKRLVTIGIAICNPEDEYNSQFGKQIAEGRAEKALEKENNLMYQIGYLKDTPQSKNKFVLSQFAETAYYHFKHNPQQYIHNFNKKKQK